MADNKELQAKFVEFKGLKEQIEQLQEYVKKTNNQIEQITEAITNIKNAHELEKGTEILVPVSNGVFIKAEVKDSKKFIVNVGSETVVEKRIEGIEKVLNTQKQEIREVQLKMVNDLDKMQDKAIKLQNEIKEMIE